MYNVPTLKYYLNQPPHPNRIEGGRRVIDVSQKVSTTDFPRVSIITVVRNGEDCLETTILSVLKQTYKNVEYIIIDGNSSDNTLDVIKKYSNDIDYWLSEPDSGIYDAMNKGIAQASGEIIGVLNAGDYYLPHTLELVTASYKSNLETANLIIAGTTQIMTKKGFCFEFKPVLEELPKRMSVPHPSLFVPIHTYKKFGLYSTNYRIVGDYEFLLRIHKSAKSTCISEILTCMAPLGASSNYFKKAGELHLAKVSNGENYFRSFVFMIVMLIINCLRLMLEKTRLWSLAEKVMYTYIYTRERSRKITLS